MRKLIGLLALIFLSPVGGRALAQPADPQKRLDQLEKRMDDDEKRHQQELKIRDEKIANLEQRLKEKTTDQPPTAADVDKVTGDILKDIESRSPVTQTLRVPASFRRTQ